MSNWVRLSASLILELDIIYMLNRRKQYMLREKWVQIKEMLCAKIMDGAY